MLHCSLSEHLTPTVQHENKSAGNLSEEPWLRNDFEIEADDHCVEPDAENHAAHAERSTPARNDENKETRHCARSVLRACLSAWLWGQTPDNIGVPACGAPFRYGAALFQLVY